VLLVTGLMFWQAWFAASVAIPLQRVAVVLHALAAFILVLAVIVHAYAAIWVKGTIGAMVRGTVSAAWAKHHHPLWYRDQVQASKK
ncbi:MAG: formate dehydrogenase cytochrome b556 subunit, partial [Burkholderiales bacterium]|nr:formate dehydrogenase cytochrome b556 subunit [Burkholderiales bacterium]